MGARLLLALFLVGCQSDPRVVSVRAGQWCRAEFPDERPHIFSGSDRFLLDTGATSTWLPTGSACPAEGELDLCAVVVGAPLCPAPGLDSIVGGGTLERAALSFDMRGMRWAVDSGWEASPPPSLHKVCSLPFVETAAGGRAFINLDIEGTVGEFLVDTGGVFVMIRQEQFDRLIADGRAHQPMLFNTAYGQHAGAFTFSSAITPCGLDIDRTLIVATGIDDILSQVEVPSGRPLAGVVGASYLLGGERTVIDYPGREARIYFRER